MPDIKGTSSGLKLADQATLNMLSVLEAESQVSQRSLAARIGVALGLTNALLKRAIRKGLVKASQAPAKRYAYYVTPKGFSEKSRLVTEYLSSSLGFFRYARNEYAEVFKQAQSDGRRSVVLYGTGELAEIASLAALEIGIEIVGVVEPGANLKFFSGMPVYPSLDLPELGEVDAVVITHAEAPQEVYNLLTQRMPAPKVYAASFLHVKHVLSETGL